MSTSYYLEKSVWAGEDFDQMGWHDATIWSMVANCDSYEFLMDLDYIFEWKKPKPPELYFKFRVAPVTMVFENAGSIKIDLTSPQGTINVMDLYREDPRLSPNGKFIIHTYRFDCREGEITFEATNFKLFVRQMPVLIKSQSLDWETRKGVDFSRELLVI